MALYDNRNPALKIAQLDELFDRAFSWEPKRQHHFILRIPDIPAYLVKTSAKPTINNGEVPLDMINIKRYVKGKSEWNEISMTLYDPIVLSGAQAVMEWIRLHHESSTGRDGYSSFYKKRIVLEQLSPLGETVEEWTLNGAFLVSAEFGSYDWSSDAVQEINISVRYDWAFLSF